MCLDERLRGGGAELKREGGQIHVRLIEASAAHPEDPERKRQALRQQQASLQSLR